MKHCNIELEQEKILTINGAFFAFGNEQFNTCADQPVAYSNLGGGLYCPSCNIDSLQAQLKKAAESKAKLADWQSFTNEFAEQHGIKANDLARGKYKREDNKFQHSNVAQDGYESNDYVPVAQNGGTMTKAEAEAQGHLIETRPDGSQYVHIVDKEGYEYDIPVEGSKGSTKTIKGKQKSWDEAWRTRDKELYPDSEWDKPKYIKEAKRQKNANPEKYEEYEKGKKDRVETVPGTEGRTDIGVVPEVAYDVDIVEEEKEKEKKKSKIPWKDVIGGLNRGLMPTDQEYFDWAQTIPEQYALISNKVEPVKAQLYKPELDVPYDISFQDRMNAMISSGNASRRMAEIQDNPAAQAMINAQEYEAINSIKGDQFRANQAKKDQVYSGNRATLNDAKLKNLGILDQQHVRQQQALSNTKDTTLAALSSMTDKQAKQKYENRELAIYENMYNYRYGRDGRAQNYNAPAQWNMDGRGQGQQTPSGMVITGYDKYGRPRYGYPSPSAQTPGFNPDADVAQDGYGSGQLKNAISKANLVKLTKEF